jgi:hypothetical protein
MFLAAVCVAMLALALLVLAKSLKARMFPDRKEIRRVRLVVERGTSLAGLREEIEASEVPLERILVRPRRTMLSWSWPNAAGRSALPDRRATPGLRGPRGELCSVERFGGITARGVVQVSQCTGARGR